MMYYGIYFVTCQECPSYFVCHGTSSSLTSLSAADQDHNSRMNNAHKMSSVQGVYNGFLEIGIEH